MVILNTNLGSLIVQSNLNKSTNSLNTAIERMTTGFKINHAKDNAANYSIVKNMSVDLSSYDVALDNVMLGSNIIDTALSSLGLVTEHLQRIRELAEQAANGTYGADSLNAIQSEINARAAEIKRVMTNTEYNGIKLFGIGAELETKRVVNQTAFQAGETYYLKTSEDLVKLQDLVNGGASTRDVTFEVVSDINMQGVDFRGIGVDNNFQGTFNGNNYKISNLTINTTEGSVGLFASTYVAEINSVVLVDCDITGSKKDTAALAGTVQHTNINNCYVSGLVSGSDTVGAIVASLGSGCNVNSCYAACDVIGWKYVGGFVGITSGSNIISDSYSECNVVAGGLAGGFAGKLTGRTSVINSYATGSVAGNITVGGFAGELYDNVTINGFYNKETTGQMTGVGTIGSEVTNTVITGLTTSEMNSLIKDGMLPKYNYLTGGEFTGGYEISLQVGIDSSKNSTLTFDTTFSFKLDVDVSNSDAARRTIEVIDDILNQVSTKQTEFGAVQNRLESVMEALRTDIENLTSTRSTIRDADIAEESSAYIRSQILQQAAATLLATANQTPAIALELL